MTTKEIGTMIKQRRMSLGMSQADLADASGISASAIGMYEAGRRRPKENVAQALSRVFNIPTWAIYYTDSEMKQNPSISDAEDPVALREAIRRDPDRNAIYTLSAYGSQAQVKQISAIIKALMPSDKRNV